VRRQVGADACGRIPRQVGILPQPLAPPGRHVAGVMAA
jgi:hypothetical protein